MESSAANGQNTFVNSQRKNFGEPYAPVSKAEKRRMRKMRSEETSRLAVYIFLF
jgi:hypothetical protein